jgi:hypothetical protein
MRTFIGAVMVTAALVLITISAVTLFTTAFNSAPEPWQQWLRAIGVVSIVAWEAAAILVIGLCWRKGHRGVAAGATIALIFAMGVTLKQELRLHVGAQADMVTKRDAYTNDGDRIRSELRQAYDRRDAIEKRLADKNREVQAEAGRGGCGDTCKDLKTEAGKIQTGLDAALARIVKLESKWDTRIEDVHATGLPEAALVTRYAGQNEQFWIDMLSLLEIAFWMFARVFALPLALHGWQLLREEEATPQAAQEPQEAPEAEPVPDTPPVPLTPVSEPETERKKPHVVVDNKKPRLGSSIDDRPSADIIRKMHVESWIKSHVKAGETTRVGGSDAYKSYVKRCKLGNHKPLSPNDFSTILQSFGNVERKRSSKRVNYIIDRTGEVGHRTAFAA